MLLQPADRSRFPAAPPGSAQPQGEQPLSPTAGEAPGEQQLHAVGCNAFNQPSHNRQSQRIPQPAIKHQTRRGPFPQQGQGPSGQEQPQLQQQAEETAQRARLGRPTIQAATAALPAPVAARLQVVPVLHAKDAFLG
jgi:hypothetical protein